MTNPRVLVVEDNPIDVRMIKRALKLGGLEEEPAVVNDGAPAIALLSRGEANRDVPLPDLVLLDLNLITVDGAQVLRFIRSQPELCKISVAILSSTPSDIMRANHGEADCYFMKPSDLETFDKLGKQILDCYQRRKALAAVTS